MSVDDLALVSKVMPDHVAVTGLVIDTNPANFYATITGVVPGGPGDRAGLRIGNLIATINRINAHNVRDVSDAIAALPANSHTVTVG